MSLLDLNLPPSDSSISSSAAAILWLKFGFTPIPTLPGKKYASVFWNAWLAGLDETKIQHHYASHPDHEVACLTNDDLIVFDADSEASIKALESLEQKFGVRPKLVVKTTRGIHHYFRRAGAIAKQDSHDSVQFPERIDIRTGRSMIMVPPSGGRSIISCDAESSLELSIAPQEFIDAVFVHNGRNAPSQKTDDLEEASCQHSRVSLVHLQKLLDLIDPDSGYQDWLNVGMAVFHETAGSSDGLSLFDSWSSGGKKYAGTKEIEVKWKSFKGNCSNPITIGTLVMLAKRRASETEVHSALADDFEPCAYEVVEPQKLASHYKAIATTATPFLRFSLKGMHEEIRKNLGDQVYVLEGIALLGQTTAIYAPPNSGKTLITLALLKDSINKGRIDPSMVYYINVDDGAHGLSERLKVADEIGIHMLSDGYLGFNTSMLFDLITEAIAQKCTVGMVLILDTMKKFTNLMDKAQSSEFSHLCTQFALKGGTVIALAHTNKNRGAGGALIPAGTSDIVDDFQCVYVIDKIPSTSDDTVAVEIAYLKGRGGVVRSLQIRYKQVDSTTPYAEMFNSVEIISEEMAAEIKHQASRRQDAEVIDEVMRSIHNGNDKKMEIVKEVMATTGETRKAVLHVLDRYRGTNPKWHLWTVETQAHGAQKFSLLDSAPVEDIVAI